MKIVEFLRKLYARFLLAFVPTISIRFARFARIRGTSSRSRFDLVVFLSFLETDLSKTFHSVRAISTRLVSGRAIISYGGVALTLSRLSPKECHGGFVVGRRCALYLRVCIQFPNGISIRMGTTWTQRYSLHKRNPRTRTTVAYAPHVHCVFNLSFDRVPGRLPMSSVTIQLCLRDAMHFGTYARDVQ